MPNWRELKHAYGSAEDIPGIISALTPDPTSPAWEDLWSRRTIRLDPGTTKNGDGRTVALTDECYFLVARMMCGKPGQDFLFTRENGEQVRDYRDAWAALVKAAGVPKLLFHDQRRCAVRNMTRRGVTERVAMKISGHKTRSVFDHYNIVTEDDLREAALKVESGGQAELARSFGHTRAILAPKTGNSEVAPADVSKGVKPS